MSQNTAGECDLTNLPQLTFERAGTSLAGEVARPTGDGPFPAVLVMASALGLGSQVRQSARPLAPITPPRATTDR